MSGLNITDEIIERPNYILHEAGRKTLMSMNSLSASVTTESTNVKTQFNIDAAEYFYGTYVTTSTGSGIRIPSELAN